MLVIPAFSKLKQKDGKFKINLGYIIKSSLVAGKVVQPVKVVATKRGYLSSVLRTHMIENDSNRLPSDLTCTMASTHK